MTTEESNEDPFAGIPAPIAQALRKRGFSELTAVQQAVLDTEFSGRDLRISSQTGSGKTVAIGIALAPHFIDGPQTPPSGAKNAPKGPPRGPSGAHPTALVIVPTRELAAQVREELRWLYSELRGLQVEVVTGGTSIMLERRALARGPALVVGTPGRLLDHMRSGALSCKSVAHVILDEADQMLDMGFREELEAIVDALPEERASHLVSATFPRAVLALAGRFQNDVLSIEGTQLGAANNDIQHIAYAVRRHDTYASLVNVLLLESEERCLLFVNRRVDASELSEKLTKDGFASAPLSGELPQAQRTRTLNAFRNGTTRILVSTDVAARGIDVPDISTVVHVDPPRTSDAYVHRSGRTGRAGRTGRSVLFVTGSEANRVKRMLQHAKIEVSWQPVPQADKVNKALVKQGRRRLHALLDGEDNPSEAQMIYAKQLLEDKDPTTLVATLLEMALPKPTRPAMHVEPLDPFKNPGSDRGARNRGASGPGRGGRRDDTTYVSFELNWGELKGATASRVLSHICRRTNIPSRLVGAIRIDADRATVDVASDASAQFETRSRQPDKRDPEITIRRAGGSRSSAPSSPNAQRTPRSPRSAHSPRRPAAPPARAAAAGSREPAASPEKFAGKPKPASKKPGGAAAKRHAAKKGKPKVRRRNER